MTVICSTKKDIPDIKHQKKFEIIEPIKLEETEDEPVDYKTMDMLFHTENDMFFEIAKISDYAFSTIIYGQIDFLMKKINEFDDGYIIVPAYLNEGKIEIQLAVTGKCKKKESPMEATRREISEELGFDLRHYNFEMVKLKDEHNNLFFSIVDEYNLLNNFQDSNHLSNCQDNPNEKIISWVYVKNIDESLIFNRMRKNSTDTAGHIISIIPIKFMKAILKGWKRKQIKKNGRFTFFLREKNREFI